MLSKRETLVLLVIIIGFIILLRFIVPYRDLTAINIISIASAIITVTGFYVTIKQLKSVKQVANQIDIAVKHRLTNFNRGLLLSDISNKIALINEIKSHLRKEQFEICIVRMEDLKRVISTIIPNATLLSLSIDEDGIHQITKNFNIDMNIIEKRLLNTSYKIRIDKIISNMDELSTYLLKMEVKLKQY